MQISINTYGALNISENINADEHRRCLMPGDSLAGESQAVINAANDAWTPQVLAAYQAMVAAQVRPTVVTVPDLDAAQIRMALTAAGLRTQFEVAVTASKDQNLKDLWNHAPTFRRNTPSIIAMATQLGVTSTQLDQLFISGAKL